MMRSPSTFITARNQTVNAVCKAATARTWSDLAKDTSVSMESITGGTGNDNYITVTAQVTAAS
jgi:hypothetical protein